MDDYDLALSKFKINDLINRKKLYHLVSLKIGKSIEYFHIISIIKILIEEIVIDLFQGRRFILDNFGAFTLKRLPPRNFYNYQTQKMQLSKGNYTLRFQLFNKFRLTILRNIDIKKTFKDENEI